MRYPFEYIKVRHSEDLNLENFVEEWKRKKRGEILHLTLSFIKTWEDFEKLPLLVKKALLISKEKPSEWNLEMDFIKPLRNLTLLPQLKVFFPPSKEKIELLLQERYLIFKNKILRPDRIILYPHQAIVVDFKTSQLETKDDLLKDYQNQIQNYTEAIFQIFKKPSYGFLLFIEKPKVEEVCFLC